MKKLLLLVMALIALSGLFAVVINEGFEGTTFPPAEWTRVGTSWTRSTSYPQAGLASARVGYSSGQHWLITPKLRPVDGANTLTFWYRDHSSDSGWDYTNEFTYVKISTATNATTDFTTTLWTGDYTTFTLTYQQATIDLSAYNGQDIFVAFHHVATGGNYRYFDEVTGVDLAPAGVPNPAIIGAPANAATGISITPTLSWSSGGGSPTGYDVYFNGSLVSSNQAGLTYVPGTLSYSTAYNWQIIPRNAAGPAINCPTWTFTTMADPTQPVPYVQDFESGTTLVGINWTGTMAISSTHGNPGNGLYYNLYSSAPSCNVVSNPIGPIPANAQVEFDYRLMNWSSYPNGGAAVIGASDLLALQVSTDNGANWDAAVYTVNQANHVTSTGWATITTLIPQYEGDTVLFRFLGTWGTGDYYVDIDNFKVRETPAGAPDAVTLVTPADGATGMQKTGFNLGWANAPTGGVPTYYAVYMSQTEENIYSDVYFETTLTTLNPTTYAGGPSAAISFNYDERWYWTVEAINGTGSAVVEPARWFTIESDPTINIPHVQEFAAATIPTGWTQTYSGAVSSNRWSVSNTNTAGGVAYEMMATWQQAIGGASLITPPINTDGIANFAVTFNNFFNDYGPGVTAKVQYSHDLSTWYDTPWAIVSGGGDVGPGSQTALITGINAPVTYVAWTLDGDLYQFDYWHVDNVNITNPPLHEVAVQAINTPEVVAPAAFAPQATVLNNGVSTETFDVSYAIGTWTDTQTVTDLAPGATALVTFAQYTPTVFTAENVVVTSLLAGDENTANDVLEGVLVCLPLDVPAFADVAFDPATVLDGPASFNLQNPGVFTDLPSANPFTNFLAGADWINNGWLGAEYVAAGGSPFWSVDTTTGAGTLLGTGTVVMSGVAHDEVNNIVYATDGTSLYTMDLLGNSTLIGALHLDGEVSWAGLMIGIAYDSFTQVLYGVDLGYDWLFTINVADGLCTPIGGGLGVGLNYAQDCAFDRENGLLYLAGYTASGALYWIDTNGGGAYKVGDFQSGAEVTGFAIPYGEIVLDAPVVTIGADGTLSWDPVAGATYYTISKSADPFGTFEFVTNLGAEFTEFLDPAFPEGKMFYQVTAGVNRSAAVERTPVRGDALRRNGSFQRTAGSGSSAVFTRPVK